MHYLDVMTVLSESGLGAVVLDEKGRISAANHTANNLLHGKGELEGRLLRDIAEPLCHDPAMGWYANVAFGEYLQRCPVPTVDDLPEGMQMIVFRDASINACHDMLMTIVNQVDAGVVLCDAMSRMWMVNNVAGEVDSLTTQDIRGKSLYEVYEMLDGSEMAIPRVIESKRPLLGLRQPYATCYGKHLDIVSDTYPIVRNGQVLGGFNLFKDWREVDQLHKKILELQEKLLNQTEADRKSAKSTLSAKYTFDDIISISPTMRSLITQCRQVAKTDSSVMIYGETGTGKELFAQSIHNASPRANGPFLAINCAAIPENLLEGILFGTEKGAYTGAERRAGLFEQASGGTLLLDELNSMNINLQGKLLRVLQDGVLRRVGGINEIRVNVRVLSNINMPPYEAIEKGRLRRDLFYRLGVVNVNIPPLCERKEDIPILAKHYIMQCNERFKRNVSDISPEVHELFKQYNWPGNVRELQHAIEHAMNVLPDVMSVITPEYIPTQISIPVTAQPDTARGQSTISVHEIVVNRSLNKRMHDTESDAICNALERSHGNIAEAARILGLSRQTLHYRIKHNEACLEALERFHRTG